MNDTFTNCLFIIKLLRKHFHFVQLSFGALLCLTIATRQCSRHQISIACFIAKLWLTSSSTFLCAMQFYLLAKKKKFKISFPLFPLGGNGHSAFLPLVPLLYATTYCISSIIGHVHVAYLIQQPRL